MCRNLLRATTGTALWVVIFSASHENRAAAQGNPTIQHEALECLQADEFPVVDARIDPGPDIRTAKVYFRSDKYVDFYFVMMNVPPGQGNDFFLGVLPKPSPETERIIYYLEAVDVYFNSDRNEQNEPLVDEKCRRDPAAAYWTGEDPGIVVGATSAGASALPPGFQAAGIVGTIATTGAMSGVGGGASVAAVAGVAAGGAGIGAFVVSTNGGGETPPPSNPPPASTATTSVVVENPPTATTSTTTTAPASGGGPTSSTTTVAGSATTTTTATGSTTTVLGSSTTSTSSSSTSSSSSTTTSVIPVSACFNIIYLGGCSLELDASCSTGSITSYNWVLDAGNETGGPYNRTGQTVTQNYGGSDGKKCSKKTVTNQLTVVGAGSSTITLSFTFPNVSGSLSIRDPEPIESSFTSFVGVQPFDGSARGTVVVNGRDRRAVDNSAPSVHRYRGERGINSIEATIADPTREGFWSFDFSSAEHFVPGSFRVESGQVVSRSSHELVFRTSGTAGERVVFRYELAYTYRFFSPR